MKSNRLISLLILPLFGLSPVLAKAQSVSLADSVVNENFDSLAQSGTSDVLPQGWYLSESDDNANTTYAADNGATGSGNTYAYGASGSSERAFGTLQSGSLVPLIGVQISNDTGSALTEIGIAYRGEQWRLGTVARQDKLSVEYSTDATSLTSGSWTAIPALEFIAPITAGGNGIALDGNNVANQVDLSTTLMGLNIADGDTLWLRWVDLNASGADDGLAIDDVSFTPPGGGVDTPPSVDSSTPTDSATDVDVVADLSIQFSEPVTLGNDAIGLVCASLTQSFALSGGPRTYTLDPASDLPFSSACSLSVEASLVVDQDGTADAMQNDFSAAFTTAAEPPDLAPTVESTVPSADAANVALDTTIQITFSEAVDLTDPWFSIDCTISGSVDADTSGGPTAYVLTPTVELQSAESCTLLIDADQVIDQDGDADPMVSDFSLTFDTTAGAGEYYATVDATNATALRSTLHALIDDHTAYPYSAGTTDTWDILEIADEDPSDSSRILDAYLNCSYDKGTDRSGAGGSGATCGGLSGRHYNREHTWPNSLGFSSSTGNLGLPNPPYTDTHMLYLSDEGYNGDRGNFLYDDCASGCGERATIAHPITGGGGSGVYPGNSNWVQSSGSTKFEVWASRKGDMARAVLYMDIRYEGGVDGNTGQTEPDLVLTDNRSLIVGTSSSPAYMGLLSTLLAWHEADPPDARERARNDVIYSFQGNRNPFIDHPEWAACLFQDSCDAPDPSPLPDLTVADVQISEGNSGTQTLTFTVALHEAAGAGGVTFDIATSDGTATAGADYVANSAIGATIAQGNSSTTFDVTVNGDLVVEPDETFVVTVSNVTGADVLDATAVGTIMSDDAGLSIADSSITEGDSGNATLNLTVSLSAALGSDVTVTASTANGSATAGSGAPSDYSALVAEEFVIAAGQTSVQIPVSVFGDLSDESDETFTVSISASAVDVIDAIATATINDNDDPAFEIRAIQGSAARSPFAPASGNANGSTVITADNIVTAVLSNGFFMQTPDARIDADVATSEGIFVFTSTAPAGIEAGDQVTVKGSVAEFFNFTQMTSPVVMEIASGVALPAAIEWDDSLPSRDPDSLTCGQTLGNFECFEGMRVTVPAGILASGNQAFGSDPYGEAYASAVGERGRREAGVRFGLSADNGQPVWDGNPEVFELDADRILAENANLALRGGSMFSATGVIGYDFGGHELWPTELTIVDDVQRGVSTASPTHLTIGSFNVLRLCETANCASTSSDPTEQEIADKIARLSLYIRDSLAAPVVLGVQEVETLAILEQLAGKIEEDGGPAYAAYLVEGNDLGGIDNGFLVRADRVSNISVRQLGLGEQITSDTGCSSAPPCSLHDRPPLLLQGTFSAGGDAFPFAVINNHLRSRSGLDTGSETARVREKRFAQASSVATYVQRFQSGEELEPTSPTGTVDTAAIPLFLVGDYNAFEVTDGWVDVVGLIAGTYDNADNQLQLTGGQIVDPALLQTSALVPLEERYSYMFAENLGNIQGQEPRRVGSAQILDHGFANAVAQPFVKGMQYARVNADAPADLATAGTGAEGSSDHDGFVIDVVILRTIFHDGFED